MKQKKRKGTTEMRFWSAWGFLSISGVLLVLAKWIPEFAEWYAVHIYSKCTAVIGGTTGLFPFSIAEFGLYLLLLLVPVSGIYTLIKAERGKRGRAAFSWVSAVFLTASVLVFLYVVNCGINYRRVSFSEKAEIEIRQYSAEDLRQVCVWLTEEVNVRADHVKRNGQGEMILGTLKKDASAKEQKQKESDGQENDSREIRRSLNESAVAAMQKLGEEYPDMKGKYPAPKPVSISEILSYQGLSGIYSPFTVEANYNQDMTDYNIPFTVCHELSHLRGFMQEEEANFIAFLACMKSERIDFQYSGYLTAWIYSMNALRRTEPSQWQELRAELAETAETDLQKNSEFWDYYEGAVAEVSDRINDTYLKANGQSAGVQSYGKMVDLLIAYTDYNRSENG